MDLERDCDCDCDRCSHDEGECCKDSRPQPRRFTRGDTFYFTVDVKLVPVGSLPGTKPVPQDISTWLNFWCTGKLNVADPDMLAVFMLTLSPVNGIVLAGTPNYRLIVTVPPIATRALPDGPVRIHYDVQGKDAAGNIYTVERNEMIVTPDMSRAIA